MKHAVLKPSLVAAAVLALAACSGSGSSSSTVSGTVAVGAMIEGAAVTFSCADGSEHQTTSTHNGSYVLSVPPTALPCAMHASVENHNAVFGTMLQNMYSYVGRAGNANITPLTTLSLAKVTAATPGAWFAEFANEPQNIDVADLEDSMKGILLAAGYQLPAGQFLPFTQKFGLGDPLDTLLDAIGEAVGSAQGFDNLIAQLVASGTVASFPRAPVASTPPANSPGSGNGAVSGGGSVGVAAFAGATASNENELLAAIGGRHEVAIWRAPEGQEHLIGKAWLTVAGDESNWTMKLETAGGELVNEIASDAIMKQVNTSIGKLFAPVAQLNLQVALDTGTITGWSGGSQDIGFRNNIAAWGSEIPAVFARLADSGLWESAGSNTNPSCTANRDSGSLEFGANGTITLRKDFGVDQCVPDVEYTVTWDGHQDFIRPIFVSIGGATQEAWLIALDTGGNFLESGHDDWNEIPGGMTVIVDSLDNPGYIYAAHAPRPTQLLVNRDGSGPFTPVSAN